MKIEELTSEYMISLVEQELRKHPEIGYSIRLSLSSISIYVMLSYFDEKLTLRISEHPSKKHLKCLVITNKTKPQQISAFVKSGVEAIHNKNFKHKLNNLVDGVIADDETDVDDDLDNYTVIQTVNF